MAHIHEVIDHDNHFVINPVTRKIEPETPEKNELVQHDHNSERYTFEIPRYVDGHDMSLCNIVQIHYINVSADKSTTNSDVYEVDDLGALADKDDTVAFSWLISKNATQLVGTLNFAVRFMCTTGEVVDYLWNTKVHTGVLISSGLNNGPVVIEEYSDVLEEWRVTLFQNVSNTGSNAPQRKIYCWGDSLTEGVGGKIKQADGIFDYMAYSYPATLAEEYDVVNCGARGEDIPAIMARQGADPIVIGGITIPAGRVPVKIGELNISAGVGLSTKNGNVARILREAEGNGLNPVKILGVEGIIYRKLENHFDGDHTYEYYFLRSKEGEAVTVPANTEVQTNAMRNYRNGIGVIWMGANGGYTSHNDYINKVKAMVEYGKYDNYIVILAREFNEQWVPDIKNAFTDSDGYCHLLYLREELPDRGYMLAGLCFNAVDTSSWDTTDVFLKKCPLLCEHISGQTGVNEYSPLHFSAWGNKAIGKLVAEKIDSLTMPTEPAPGPDQPPVDTPYYETDVTDKYGNIKWRLTRDVTPPSSGYIDTGWAPYDTEKDWTIACAYSDDFVGLENSIAVIFESRIFRSDEAQYQQVAVFMREYTNENSVEYSMTGGTGGFSFPIDGVTLSSDGWHYVVITKQGSNYSFYLDGNLAYGCALGYEVPENLLFDDTMLLFARRENGIIHEKSSGTIKQFRIYDSYMNDATCKNITNDMMNGIRD